MVKIDSEMFYKYIHKIFFHLIIMLITIHD